MKIELSKAEAATLKQALKAWETQPISEAMSLSLISAMLFTEEDYESGKTKQKPRLELERAKSDAARRSVTVTLLMAKIIAAEQAETQETEHISA